MISNDDDDDDMMVMIMTMVMVMMTMIFQCYSLPIIFQKSTCTTCQPINIQPSQIRRIHAVHFWGFVCGIWFISNPGH